DPSLNKGLREHGEVRAQGMEPVSHGNVPLISLRTCPDQSTHCCLKLLLASEARLAIPQRSNRTPPNVQLCDQLSRSIRCGTKKERSGNTVGVSAIQCPHQRSGVGSSEIFSSQFRPVAHWPKLMTFPCRESWNSTQVTISSLPSFWSGSFGLPLRCPPPSPSDLQSESRASANPLGATLRG